MLIKEIRERERERERDISELYSVHVDDLNLFEILLSIATVHISIIGFMKLYVDFFHEIVISI